MRSHIFILTILLLCAPHSWAENQNEVTINYRDLVDPAAIVRTGQSIREVLSAPLNSAARGFLQPFLDQHVDLLPDALDMVTRPSATPFQDISLSYPQGASEPAWVELFRNGKFLALYDGRKRVRLFLPGRGAEAAYRTHYGLLRHCLGTLAKTAGRIDVEAYSYTHDYRTSEMVLNIRPYKISGESFPVARGRVALNLTPLFAFFREGKTLGGAEIGRSTGLTLLASDGGTMRIDGAPATLSDLAVAYRAVFHAGDNAAFISLDPHADPTLASVNFGGYLENTAIGRTVLEADKRFKTIAAGIDPNTFADLRNGIRASQSQFLAAIERDFLKSDGMSGKWVGTRFWFYPESVEIETDDSYGEARIVKARFTADAERQRDDYASSAEFERFKRTQLSPGIRACIDDLNAHYGDYAKVFPELAELDAVARLLGICSWMKRRPNREIDLDALLSVDIPVKETPKERTQLVVSAWLAAAENESVDSALVASRTAIQHVSPFLDKTVAEFFGVEENYKVFLGLAENEGGASGRRPVRPDWTSAMNRTVRTVINSRTDLQAFVKMASALLNHGREKILAENTGRNYRSMNVLSIGGGINLGPDQFTVRVKPRRTARTAGQGASAGRGSPQRTPAPPAPQLTRPAPTNLPVVTELNRALPRPRIVRDEGIGTNRRRISAEAAAAPNQAGSVHQENYWFRREDNGSWREKSVSDNRVRERTFNTNGSLTVIEHRSDAPPRALVARRASGGKIVFRRETRPPNVEEGSPAWWDENGNVSR